MRIPLLLIATLLATSIDSLSFRGHAHGEESPHAPVSRFLSDVPSATAPALEPQGIATTQSNVESDEPPKGNSLGALMAKSAGELRPIRSQSQVQTFDERRAGNLQAIQQVQPVSAVKQASNESFIRRTINYQARSDRQDESARGRSDSTRSHLAKLRKPIGEIDLSWGVDQGVPENRSKASARSETILISALGSSPPLPDRYTVGFMHRPLYFEQPRLERCGESCGHFQNMISGARFVADTFLLPYHLCRQRPGCLVPAGGDCRTCQTISEPCKLCPLDCKALATQSAAVAGFAFLVL